MVPRLFLVLLGFPLADFTESTEDRESLIESVEIGSQFFGVLGLGIGLI